MNEEPDAGARQRDTGAPVDDTPQLPSIDSLDEHSDYRAFMSDKVSEELRLQALRKLFRLPQFNVCDGLDDYDEDFASCKPLGSIVTHDMARGLDRVLEKAGTPDAATPLAPAAPGEAAARATQEPGVSGDDEEEPPAG